jgi:peptidoglycan hydrolase-like protein with peptidoglycan-binding domain
VKFASDEITGRRDMTKKVPSQQITSSPSRAVMVAGACVAALLAGSVWSNLLSGHHEPFERVADAPPVKVVPAPRAKPAPAARTTNAYPSSSVSVSVPKSSHNPAAADDPLGQLILQTGSAGMAPVAAPGADGQASPGMALEAQQALAQLDYYHGPVDGLVGPAYEEAVRKYQVMNGLPVTGVVTRPVLDHMQMAATVIFAQSTDVIVHKVQTALAELGYSPGQVDGRMGQQTREAIRVFEADRGWQVTGQISEQLLAELPVGRDMAASGQN